MPAYPGYGTPTVPLEASVALNILFPRDSCVTCSDSSPTCPSCDDGYSCQVTVPLDCTECAKSYCALDETAPSATSTPSKSSQSPKTGAIAGGVIGGIAFIAIVTYLVWRYCVKPKRQQEIASSKSALNLDHESIDGGVSFASRRDQRASTHTAHSIASTVLTRASNIIQIAYIPGVMNRATPTSPGVLVPPVPPIPITISGATSPNGTSEQHFFVPGDLRDSTYSGYSGLSDRASVARTSYAPRSSIASTIYGKNAVIVAPPQTGMRAKPTMVNLKSPSAPGTPPVPSVDYEKYNQTSNDNLRPVSIANSTFSVGSTFLNSASASAVTPVRPVMVRVESGLKKSPLSMASSKTSVSVSDEKSEQSEKGEKGDKSDKSDKNSEALGTANEKTVSTPTTATARDSTATTAIGESPSVDQGPFSDPPASPGNENDNSTLLASVPEETTGKKSGEEEPKRSSDRGRSPFGDEHATRDE